MGSVIQIESMNVYEDDETSSPLLLDINIEIEKPSIVSVTGESGTGKSLLAFSLLSKEYLYNAYKEYEMFSLNGVDISNVLSSDFAYIPQEPLSSLNPTINIKKHFEFNNKDLLQKDLTDYYRLLLREVGFGADEEILIKYPHELSGGMAQRVLIALALQNNPKILIADEATSSLDAVNEKNILDLLKRISDSRELTTILITHDVRVARKYCTRHYNIKEKKIYLLESIESTPLLHNQSLFKEKNSTKNNQEVIKVENLSFNFKSNNEILKGINFAINTREIVGLIGLSGSGKSTITKLLMKLHKPRKGISYLFGKDISEYSPKDYASYVQIVFQDLYGSLNPKRKIIDILLDSFLINQSDEDENIENSKKNNLSTKEEIIYEYIDKVGLDKQILHRFSQSLSGGQRQKILILKALLVKPAIIIFDEPMSSLDIKSQNEIIKIIKSLYLEDNLTILFITHDYRLVEALCNRVMVLSDGEIVENGDVQEVLNNPKHSGSRKILEVVK
ncbi:ABC transporter ATP-binding protein [bacterium]|nr:ABC transporter ATP-binding protein [bacterium]